VFQILAVNSGPYSKYPAVGITGRLASGGCIWIVAPD